MVKIIKISNQDEDIIYAVVANKSDLASENTIPDEKGKEYAKKIGAEWRITSAKKEGIGELIHELFMKFYKNFYSKDIFNDARMSFSISTKAKKRGCC